GARWGVSVVSDGGAETISEVRAARRTDLVGQAMQHPLVQAVVAAFPGVTDQDIQVREPVVSDAAAPLPVEALDQDENWDPLDDGFD
ncbi:MAG: DNA polymerase III subunit gamma/tau, partial [Pseudomonadota bacterium]